MKRVLFAALALIGFSAAGFAQTVHAVKKNEPSKIHAFKKETDKKEGTRVIAMNKPHKKTTPLVTNAATKPAPGKKEDNKSVVSSKTSKVNHPGPLKANGTADMRYKANKAAAKNSGIAHLKKDGTKDRRFKETQKHS